MPFLRAPYWRRTWVDSSYIPYAPSEFSAGITGVWTGDGVGSLAAFYDDESPSDVTVYAEDSIGDPYDDGNLYTSWTDNTGGLRQHRLMYRLSSNTSWKTAAQYEPSRTTGVVGNLIQTGSYDVAVQSIDTADNFLSQITHVTHILS